MGQERDAVIVTNSQSSICMVARYMDQANIQLSSTMKGQYYADTETISKADGPGFDLERTIAPVCNARPSLFSLFIGELKWKVHGKSRNPTYMLHLLKLNDAIWKHRHLDPCCA